MLLFSECGFKGMNPRILKSFWKFEIIFFPVEKESFHNLLLLS